ncbi:hypothetical protein ABK040_010275 [Willaertia magna]
MKRTKDQQTNKTISKKKKQKGETNRNCFLEVIENLKKDFLDELAQSTRTDVFNEIESKLKECIDNHSGDLIYLLGQPGTGKSFVMKKVIKDYKENSNFRKEIPIIDCASITSAKELDEKIAKSFRLESSPKKNTKKLKILILDSCDTLFSSSRLRSIKEKLKPWIKTTVIFAITNILVDKNANNLICFSLYSENEILQIVNVILKPIIENNPPLIDNSILKHISKAFNEKDIRQLFKFLDLLLDLVKDSKEKIGFTHYTKVMQNHFKLGTACTVERIKQLSTIQKRLLYVIGKYNQLVSNVTLQKRIKREDNLNESIDEENCIEITDDANVNEIALSQDKNKESDVEEALNDEMDIYVNIYLKLFKDKFYKNPKIIGSTHLLLTLTDLTQLFNEHLKQIVKKDEKLVTSEEIKEYCEYFVDLGFIEIESITVENKSIEIIILFVSFEIIESSVGNDFIQEKI